MEENEVKNRLYEVMLYSGIKKKATSHWARHSFAVMMLSMGVPMHRLSKMLGHASTRITEEVYAKVLNEDLQKDYEMVNSKLK